MADSEPAVYSAPVASIGHFVVDLNQGCLPALPPFLKTAHQLSYAAARFLPTPRVHEAR
jgi:hypothetical protein